MQIAGWSGTNGRFDERTYQGLPSCSLLVRYYVHPDYQAPVDLAIVYGTDLGDFHQPEICLEGQGLKPLEKSKITIKTRAGSFQAIRLITESDFERRAFIFWFAGQGSTSTFLGDYKVKVFVHRLLARRIEPSAMVRLSTVVATTDDDAVNTIVRFVQVAFPYLQQEFQAGLPQAK